jgi:hypothetical protein
MSGQKKKPFFSCCGCLLATGIGIVGLIIFGAFVGSRKNKGETNTQASAEQAIPYEVLKNEKRNGDGKQFFEVLVSEDMTKETVLKLAEQFKQKYKGNIALIQIWDSREAAKREMDMTYPEKLLLLHSLVVISGVFDEKITWIGKGRDH